MSSAFSRCRLVALYGLAFYLSAKLDDFNNRVVKLNPNIKPIRMLTFLLIYCMFRLIKEHGRCYAKYCCFHQQTAVRNHVRVNYSKLINLCQLKYQSMNGKYNRSLNTENELPAKRRHSGNSLEPP